MSKITILGSGTSQGVPTIGCQCEVCRSTDPRDARLRSSAMIEHKGVRLIIDAGVDFRAQMLRSGVTHINGLLLTHEHKDHTGGIDDVRALNFVDYPKSINIVKIYATRRTLDTVRKDYDYAFVVDKYRGVPEIDLCEITPPEPFFIDGCEVIPISGKHSPRFDVTGFRIANLAYLTDFKTIEPAEEAKLLGLEVLVVNALRFGHHPSHFNVEEALALISRVKPKRAYLTHMSHDIGLYDYAQSQLPEGVTFCYDMMEILIEDE